MWDPVPCLQRNDEIVEYMVDIGISGNVALRVRLVENGTSLTETGLEAGMSYFFEVFAVGNSTGQGVGATPLHLQTLLGEISVYSQVTVRLLSDNFLGYHFM